MQTTPSLVLGTLSMSKKIPKNVIASSFWGGEIFFLCLLFSLIYHQLNISFFISLFFLYSAFCSPITFASFLQRVYSQDLFIGPMDLCKAFLVTLFRYFFLHWVLNIVRLTSFIGYKKRKREWGEIKRVKQFV